MDLFVSFINLIVRFDLKLKLYIFFKKITQNISIVKMKVFY